MTDPTWMGPNLESKIIWKRGLQKNYIKNVK